MKMVLIIRQMFLGWLQSVKKKFRVSPSLLFLKPFISVFGDTIQTSKIVIIFIFIVLTKIHHNVIQMGNVM